MRINQLDKERLKKGLLVLISCLPKRYRKVTAIEKYTFFAQFEGFYPSIAKTLRYHGAYSRDIDYMLNELATEGLLMEAPTQTTQTNLVYSNASKLYDIDQQVEEDIGGLADELGIDYDLLKKRMHQLSRTIGYTSDAMGEKSRQHFIDILAEPSNYLYLNPTQAPDIHPPLSLARLQPPYQDIGKIGYWVLRHKEDLPSYSFDTSCIKADGRIGSYVFLGGCLLTENRKELMSGTVVKFTSSVINPSAFEIPLILPRNGIFTQSLSEMEKYDCLVIGKITQVDGVKMIEAAGVLCVGLLGESDFLY